MIDAIWWVLIPVCFAGAAVAGFALGKQERPQTFTSAERIEELKEELRHERGRREAMVENEGARFGEIKRLRRRLQLVEGLLSRSAWINGCDFTMRLSADDAVAMREELERLLLESDASILDFCMEVSRDRALLTIEELRRIENHPADDDDGVTS
jgi:hypothetical protein